MYCWKMRSVIGRRYAGTQILCTSAIAALNEKLVFKNIHVYLTLEKHLKREFQVLRRYIFYVMYIFFNFVQWVAFGKISMFDLVLM